MAVVPITAPTLDTTAAQVGGSTYGQTAEQAQQAFRAAGEQVAQSRQAQMGATGAAAAGATMTEEERRRLREQQEAMSAAVAGEGPVDIASQQAQQQQLEYLRGLQETGGAQALTAQQQAQLATALQAQAAGQVSGAGQMQLRRALEATQAATASQVAGLRGINPAAAQRLLTQAQAAQAQTAAGQSALVALEEQEKAQAQLGALYGQMRGQDIAAQEASAQQMAALLTAGRAQDVASGQLQTQRDQLAANILQGVRAGDVDAVNAAIASAQAQRQADIAARAQELGLYDAAGRLDVAAAQLKAQQAIAQAQLDFEAGRITQAQLQAEENFWRDFWTKAGLGAIGTATAVGAKAALGAAKGGRIPGRPLVKGDHPTNDIVPALLSPGEIVIPRSIAQAADAPEKAAAFVRALQKAESAPLSRSAAARKIAALEAELAALRAARREA